MAGMKLPIVGKTRYNPTLATGTTILVLNRDLDVGQAREGLLCVRVHGAPTLTTVDSVKVILWAVSICADEPGTDFIYRDTASGLAPKVLASVTLPAAAFFSSLPANNGWAGMAPVNINSTTQTGNFGSRLRAVLEIVATSTPTVDLFLSADLDLKA